jgi:hypothetical protein
MVGDMALRRIRKLFERQIESEESVLRQRLFNVGKRMEDLGKNISNGYTIGPVGIKTWVGNVKKLLGELEDVDKGLEKFTHN